MSPQPPPMPPSPTEGRNRDTRRAFLIGCLGCGGMLFFALVLATGIAAIVFSVMGDSEAAKTALREAQASPVMVEELGEPIELGWFITGSIRAFNEVGEADVRIPVQGPTGTASIHVVGTREEGLWNFSTVEATLSQSGRKVDLLTD